MMNYTDFKAQMLELCDKNAQNHPSLNELIYFFEKYDVTYKLINSKNMAYTMRNFASFDTWLWDNNFPYKFSQD